MCDFFSLIVILVTEYWWTSSNGPVASFSSYGPLLRPLLAPAPLGQPEILFVFSRIMKEKILNVVCRSDQRESDGDWAGVKWNQTEIIMNKCSTSITLIILISTNRGNILTVSYYYHQGTMLSFSLTKSLWKTIQAGEQIDQSPDGDHHVGQFLRSCLSFIIILYPQLGGFRTHLLFM